MLRLLRRLLLPIALVLALLVPPGQEASEGAGSAIVSLRVQPERDGGPVLVRRRARRARCVRRCHRGKRRSSRSHRAPWGTAAPSDETFRRLANCESADGRNSANGKYHGYFQFDLATWRNNGGGPGDPRDYSYDEQLVVARTTQSRRGWYSPWPTCARRLGL